MNVLGTLYGVWGATRAHGSMLDGQVGLGVLFIWLFAIPLVFIIWYVIAALLVVFSLSALEGFGLRLMVVAVALGIFYAGHLYG